MDGMKRHVIQALMGLVAILWLVPTVGVAATLTVDCNAGDKLQPKVDNAKAGDILQVVGTCNENVLVHQEIQRITIDGQGKATIKAPDAKQGAVLLRGRGIVIKRFSISGGQDGIRVDGGGTAQIEGNVIQGTGRDGIHIASGTADIDNNAIELARTGIVLDRNSFALITKNMVRNNRGPGVVVRENSVARIGVSGLTGNDVSPNFIQSNGGPGLTVWRSSTAWIVGNTIGNNKGNGVWINRSSQAYVANNTINGNAGDAINVSHGSGVTLGSDDSERQDEPNKTEQTVNSAGFGINCSVGGYVDGRLGTLSGTKGAKNFETTCHDGVKP